MNENLKTFILIGEILVEGTTTNSLEVTGLDDFGSIYTFDDLSEYLNLIGILTPTGKQWTGINVKVFCYRMNKEYPDVWNEHIQHEHIGHDRWGLTVGSISPQQTYKPCSNDGPYKMVPNNPTEPKWVDMEKKPGRVLGKKVWPDYWFHDYQQSLPENERLPIPDDLL